MAKKRYEVILHHETRSGDRSFVSLTRLARLSGCHPDLVERLVQFGLIEPAQVEGEKAVFEDTAVARLRKALRLRRDFSLNLNALPIVLELLDRVDELEAELARLRGKN